MGVDQFLVIPNSELGYYLPKTWCNVLIWYQAGEQRTTVLHVTYGQTFRQRFTANHQYDVISRYLIANYAINLAIYRVFNKPEAVFLYSFSASLIRKTTALSTNEFHVYFKIDAKYCFCMLLLTQPVCGPISPRS